MLAFGTVDKYRCSSHGERFVVEEESVCEYFFPSFRDHSVEFLPIPEDFAIRWWLAVEVGDNSVGTQNMPVGDSHSNQQHFVDAAAANKRTLAVGVILLCVSHLYSLDGNAPLEEEAEKGSILVQCSVGEKGI